MSRSWSPGTLALVWVVLLGCGRTLSAGVPGAPTGNVDGGTEVSGSSMSRPDPSVDDPANGPSGTPPAGTTGGTGAANPPTTGAAGSSTQAPPVGSGGIGFHGPGAPDVLNPNHCATEEPFVISIDPGGASGEVRGWLESAPAVVFDDSGLPRFGAEFDASTANELVLSWSIASQDDKTFWLYVQDADTEVAVTAAQSAAELGDATQLRYTGLADGTMSVGQVNAGDMTVFHHIPTDRYLAFQVLDLFGTDVEETSGFCAAIDARWLMAPKGTGDFSGFE